MCWHLQGCHHTALQEGCEFTSTNRVGRHLPSSCLDAAATFDCCQFEGNGMIIKWYFTGTFILISLTTGDFEPLFKCLFPIKI